MYDPETGRFLQRDPVWDPGNVGNQYTFCGNNSPNCVDPMGTDWMSVGKAVTLAWALANGAGAFQTVPAIVPGAIQAAAPAASATLAEVITISAGGGVATTTAAASVEVTTASAATVCTVTTTTATTATATTTTAVGAGTVVATVATPAVVTGAGGWFAYKWWSLNNQTSANLNEAIRLEQRLQEVKATLRQKRQQQSQQVTFNKRSDGDCGDEEYEDDEAKRRRATIEIAVQLTHNTNTGHVSVRVTLPGERKGYATHKTDRGTSEHKKFGVTPWEMEHGRYASTGIGRYAKFEVSEQAGKQARAMQKTLEVSSAGSNCIEHVRLVSGAGGVVLPPGNDTRQFHTNMELNHPQNYRAWPHDK